MLHWLDDDPPVHRAMREHRLRARQTLREKLQLLRLYIGRADWPAPEMRDAALNLIAEIEADV